MTVKDIFEVKEAHLDAIRGMNDLIFFSENVLGFKNEPFHKTILEALSKNPRRLLVLAFRGSGKSTILECQYPLWRIIGNRDIRILQVSHSVNQVAEFLRQSELIMATHQRFRELYGNLIPENKTLTWTDTEKIVLGRSGQASHVTIRALGAQAGILGRRADAIICDDLVNSQNSSTEQQRRNLSAWFWQELLPVLEPSGSIFVIGTKWSPGDLYEELINKGWPAIIIPAINVVDGKEVSAWPERFSLEELHSRKEAMGTIYFNLQYMNSTSDFSGNLLKRSWLKYTTDIPKKDLSIFFGVDPCITGKTDFLAIAVIGLDADSKTAYLLDMLHTKAEIGRELELIKEYAALWKPRVIGIESNAAQRMLADHLSNTTLLPIKRITTQKDKLSRFISMSVLFESGRVVLKGQQTEEGMVPIEALNPFVEEWIEFPKSPHDDALDAVVIALDLAMYFGPKAASAIVEPEPDPNRGRRFTPIFRHGRIGGIRDDSIDSSEVADKTPRPPKRGKVRGTPSSGS